MLRETNMYSPIIVFNPEGLTEDQAKRIKDALDAAYRAGYETAKEFYQFKLDTTKTTSPLTTTTPPWTIYNGQAYGVIYNDCTHGVDKGTYAQAGNTFADTEGTFANTQNTYCGHMFVTPENKANGICGLCGISFDEWHG
jgi:hypothetical protein